MQKQCSLYQLVGECLQNYACPFLPPNGFLTERSYLQHLNEQMDKGPRSLELPPSPSDELPDYLYKCLTKERVAVYTSRITCTGKHSVQWKGNGNGQWTDLVECDLLQLIHYVAERYKINPPSMYTSKCAYVKHVYNQLPPEWFDKGFEMLLHTVLRDKIKEDLHGLRKQHGYAHG